MKANNEHNWQKVNPKCVTIQMKANEQCLHVVLFQKSVDGTQIYTQQQFLEKLTPLSSHIFF